MGRTPTRGMTWQVALGGGHGWALGGALVGPCVGPFFGPWSWAPSWALQHVSAEGYFAGLSFFSCENFRKIFQYLTASRQGQHQGSA